MSDQYSAPFELVYPPDRFDGRLPDPEIEKLRACLRTLSPAADAVIAGRAALRSAHFVVAHVDEPGWTAEWKDRLIDLFVLVCRAGACALAGHADDPHDIEKALEASTRRERHPDESLLAALAAVRAATDPDPAEACLAAVVASIGAAFWYPSIDPGTTRSYGPPFAADAASAVANDVRAVIDGVDPSEVAGRPLWPADVWGATMWPRIRTALVRAAASPRTPPKGRSIVSRITDRFRSPTRGRPAVPRQEGLENWVAWFDERMRGSNHVSEPSRRFDDDRP